MLIANEQRVRAITALFYRGNAVYCTICERSFKKFVDLNSGERLCPNCGSLPRHRRLYFLLKPILSGKIILDFSPSRALYRKFKGLTASQYVATDFANEFLSDKRLDITCIAEPDESFDLIICYHILEHIEKDRQAMKELYRVLRKGGECWIQTPFKDGLNHEDDSITSKEQRLLHFGQEDHVRIYSVNGLKERLEEAGFVVAIHKHAEQAEYGFEEEIILIAKK